MGESPRDFKCNYEHWSTIVQYCEMYPQIIKSKFENFQGDKRDIRNLWEELTDQLNGLGYGKKSIEKWQLAIGRWKSKVKAKALNLKLEMEQTGGGPVKSPPLNDIEERLINLMGWKSITGDKNKELGLGISEVATTPIEPPPLHILNTHLETNTETQGEMSFLKQCSISSTGSRMEIELSSKPSTSTAYKENIPTKKRSSQEAYTKRKVVKSSEKSRRYVTLTHMHNENLTILKKISENTSDIARSIREIKDTMTQYVEYLKNCNN
ncbi:uncharacterized protein LOC108916773 isoform X2 [Anoplophora glabripennis]|uniref:uncharacterized protein LOC108916773 isoform X2 n=1 Tax=Anoplophora glabripennis TaxID=217634 RepID=UPI000875049F|nr:uncharacterized protein LOC108916773 isoform X2 [Anoplophora glabripennis]